MNDSDLLSLFDATIECESFAHAYLVYDTAQSDKQSLILDIIKNYLSFTDQAYSNLLDHPDIVLLNYENSIKLQNIHSIQDRIKYGPNNFKKAFVIIPECHNLSSQAANAFLKTLEEPHENIIFFLTSSNFQQVLSTIKSRCICIYSQSEVAVSTTDFIEYSTFKGLSLIDKMDLFNTKIASKEEFISQLLFWINYLYQEDSLRHNNVINFLTNTIKRLQFNVNLRLQLEYLCIGI